MKFHVIFTVFIIALFANLTLVAAQVNGVAQTQIDAVVGQVSSSATNESFAGGISGDGRLVVFESTGNLATENPRNADGNREIFVFDYAQRRIFQITDTRSLRNNTTAAFSPSNTRVLITNQRPVISNDGRWIAFGSNATIAFPGNGTSQPPIVSTTNPGSFDAETFNPTGTNTTPPNPLLADGNTEMWLYQVPAVAAANLSTGDEIPVTDLSGGTFTRVTNTVPSRLPFAGSATNSPIIGDDNRDASINDNGNVIAFVSNRDAATVTPNNAGMNGNDEIFTFARLINQVNQITVTPRGTIVDPTVNLTPTISGLGTRVAFQSNADKPISTIAESNADRNFEVFYTDLDGPTGAVSVSGLKRQITVTARTNPGDIVNLLDFGRRMSRDGRYIALDSFADLANATPANQTSFALYLYDTTPGTFRQIGPRSNADTTSNSDVPHFPGFTDTLANGAPQTLVFGTRQNITADGTVAATNDAGLNPNASRPIQFYAYPLVLNAGETLSYKRLTRFPATSFVTGSQPITSNSVRRMTFNFGFTELGTGNSDLGNEVFYYLLPVAEATSPAALNYATGASRQPISPSPVPTPSPTATPSPTPTPTGTPTATPTPTPQTSSAVQGVSPGLLTILNYNSGNNSPVIAREAVGSLSRRFTLPIELSGVTMTINGAACGLRSVGQRQIVFVVPPGLTSLLAGTSYPVVINNNGVVFRGTITVVPTRPDVFSFLPNPNPGGRARIFNVTNTVFRTEPFNVTTLRLRGGRRVPTVLRLFVTGVEGAPASITSIRVRDVNITPTTAAVLREPGVYSFDFTLPLSLQGAGDVPIIVTLNVNGTTFQSRLDDTAPFFRIL